MSKQSLTSCMICQSTSASSVSLFDSLKPRKPMSQEYPGYRIVLGVAACACSVSRVSASISSIVIPGSICIILSEAYSRTRCSLRNG